MGCELCFMLTYYSISVINNHIQVSHFFRQVVPQDDSPSQTATVDAPEETSSAQINPNQTLTLELDPTFVKK